MKLSHQPYKGTRDYYPEQKRIQNYIFDKWRKVVELYGYEEYGTPLLEPLDIYAAKSGQELVNDETYAFKDRGGRTVAIRPELTPSVSRIVAARRQEMSYPARLYSIANFMRYERPQYGREREFWQLNIDIFGVRSVWADAEIINLASKIVQEFGATEGMFIIRINNRHLINLIMAQVLSLDSATSLRLMKLLDKKNKMPEEDFWQQVKIILPDEEVFAKAESIIKAKAVADLPEEVLKSSAMKDVQKLFTILEQQGIKNAVFDITLMRGLDYYTGTVFEVFDTDPDNRRAMFGGGSYDGLVDMFGVAPVPAVGAAPGATVFENFLKAHDLLPELNSIVDVNIIVDDGKNKAAKQIAEDLRAQGIKVAIDFSARKPDKQLKAAMKNKVKFVLFVDEESVSGEIFNLKNLFSDERFRETDIDSLVERIKTA